MSPTRAWLNLVLLCWQRQARARQMVWIALGLMAFAVLFVGVNTAAGGWDVRNWRYPRRGELTYEQWRQRLDEKAHGVALGPGPAPALREAVLTAVLAASDGLLAGSDFFRFSRFLFSTFLSFLLPAWGLSFATESFGGEREGGNFVWLLTRPLSRPAIYLAKFVALLPWSLGLNLGGFALLCLAGGRPGRLALQLYWPAVLWGTLAFSALFLFIGACFRRPAVVAIVYSFFLETIFGNMPGYLKRASISFYTRCMMFEAAQDYHVQPEKPTIYLPVDGDTALWVLAGVTVGLLALGMAWFSRLEYVAVE